MKNIQSEARLTFGEATSIIVGHGVGAGILSIPFLASRNSIFDLVWVLALAYGTNLLLHYIIAELSYNNNGAQFIKCFETELFTGRLKKIFTWLAFALLGFSVIVNVSGFLTGAAAVFGSWFGMPRIGGVLLFYLIGGSVVFFGMKLVGLCEKVAVVSMLAVIGVLVVGTLRGETQSFSGDFVSLTNVLALYSMIAFALSAVMSVPQVVKGLDGDVKKIRASIALGTGINLFLILVITLTTLAGVGRDISQNGALVDLSEHLGGWVGIIGYIFTLLALATSFWANTLDLRDIVNEQTRWGVRSSWAAATLPSLAIALLGVTSFVGFTRLASIVQVLTGVGVIIAYNRSRRRMGTSPICGRVGTLPFQLLVLVASVASTVGALLKIN
ncbi:aromatic amino acid transport family protein [Pygmaiobacter massiliensis]|uniref:aromatic amino acid transport family protein n=1 Tax=Pygmaiobacter massiliensis TaxID=1917873 RepID=UPI002A7FC479|nr:aromatic amino acid transport family protein [Pygmaiobacter massiliensis]MDY4785486.1 aromatic amino acid transport family protein [Pygmaiobacter massiliensis]